MLFSLKDYGKVRHLEIFRYKNGALQGSYNNAVQWYLYSVTASNLLIFTFLKDLLPSLKEMEVHIEDKTIGDCTQLESVCAS